MSDLFIQYCELFSPASFDDRMARLIAEDPDEMVMFNIWFTSLKPFRWRIARVSGPEIKDNPWIQTLAKNKEEVVKRYTLPSWRWSYVEVKE